MALKTIIFDLDDTIYPEYEFVFNGYRAVDVFVKERFGVSIFNQLQERFLGGERGDLFTPTLASLRISVDENFVRNEIVPAYRFHSPKINPYPSFLKSLTFFRQYKLGLITDGISKVQRNKIESLGIQDLFQSIVVSSEISPECCKPSPLPYQKVIESVGCSPEETVYIADNPLKDFTYPLSCGMRTFLLRNSAENPHLIYKDIPAVAGLDAICTSYEQIVETLREFS